MDAGDSVNDLKEKQKLVKEFSNKIVQLTNVNNSKKDFIAKLLYILNEVNGFEEKI